MKIKDIAKKIYEGNSIVLIYAFNGTGKTRLSVEYKNLTKSDNDDHHQGVYYNAYSEDLFIWDNDEENGNENIRLEIKPSSLNQYHSFFDSEALEDKLLKYGVNYSFELNISDNPELGFESVSFFENEEKSKTIKISRGEENIFIWCFFSTLFEIDSGFDEQNAHFFIDDPVSSLDEHNIYLTADSIFKIIEDSFEANRKVIITTHHIGLFSILHDRLKKGEKADRYMKNTDTYILSKGKEALNLNPVKKDIFLFHLHLLQVLDEAIKTDLYKFHFVLLRQLLENISSFLGTGRVSYCLEQIELKKEEIETTMMMINSISHQNMYGLRSKKLAEKEENLFKEIFDKIQTKYHFKF